METPFDYVDHPKMLGPPSVYSQRQLGAGLLDETCDLLYPPHHRDQSADRNFGMEVGPSTYSSHWQNYTGGPNSYGKPPRFGGPGDYGAPPSQNSISYERGKSVNPPTLFYEEQGPYLDSDRDYMSGYGPTDYVGTFDEEYVPPHKRRNRNDRYDDRGFEQAAEMMPRNFGRFPPLLNTQGFDLPTGIVRPKLPAGIMHAGSWGKNVPAGGDPSWREGGYPAPLSGDSWRSSASLKETEGIIFEDEDGDERSFENSGHREESWEAWRSSKARMETTPKQNSFPTNFSKRQPLLASALVYGANRMQQSFSNQLSFYTSGKVAEEHNSGVATGDTETVPPGRPPPLLGQPPDTETGRRDSQKSGEPALNPQHPAYGKDVKYTVDGPDKFREYIDHPTTILIFDTSYESSIWDYDPKFTWDYLPGTKRGTQNPEKGTFVVNQDYVFEEHKWKKFEKVIENHWKNNFVPKIKEQQRYIEAGLEPPPLKPKKPALENKPETVFNYFVEKIGFPEDNITLDYCGLCDIAFNSTLASINHYETEKHDKSVNKFFVSSLYDHNLVQEDDATKIWVEMVLKRLLKKYKLKPRDYKCTICDVNLSSAGMARTHFSGTNHQRKVKGLPTVQKCTPEQRKIYLKQCVACKVHFGNQREVLMHIQTKVHIMNVQACTKHGIALPPGPSSEIGRTKFAKKNMQTVAGEQNTAGFAQVGLTGSNMMPLGSGEEGMNPSDLYCATCNKSLYSKKQYEMHMRSEQHTQKETNLARMAIRGRAPPRLGLAQKKAGKSGGITVAQLGEVPQGAIRISVCKPQAARATATITRTFAVTAGKSSGVKFGGPSGVGFGGLGLMPGKKPAGQGQKATSSLSAGTWGKPPATSGQPNSRLAAAVKAIQSKQWVKGTSESGTKFQ